MEIYQYKNVRSSHTEQRQLTYLQDNQKGLFLKHFY